MSLEKEQEYVKAHFGELLKSYEGQYILVYEQKVRGYFADFETAYKEAVNRYKDAPFLITRMLQAPPVNFLAYAG